MPSASERVRTFELIEPPFALLPVGVVREVTIEEPEASLVNAIFAELLISAFTISPSRIFAEVTDPVPSVKTPRVLVRSPLAVVNVGTPVPLAIRI